MKNEKNIWENPLLVFALENEAGNLFTDYRVLFTEIGKVNAAYSLTKAIAAERPSCIINLGTAGSAFFNRAEVVACTQFVQRDMDASKIGFPKYKTPLTEIPEVLEYGIAVPHLRAGICGSGDSFETQLNETIYNLVDMEAYALAHVSYKEEIPFICLKYISDGANDEAAVDWKEQVHLAAKALHKELRFISPKKAVY